VDAEVFEVASYMTPVPGGVGPMTVAMLLKNCCESAFKSCELENSSWNMKYLDLDLKRPVPSDIEIARAQTPKDIGMIASEAGILDSELCRYGNTKAKVSLKGMLIELNLFWAKY